MIASAVEQRETKNLLADSEEKDPVAVLLSELAEAILQNGDLSTKARGIFQLRALKMLIENIVPLTKRVENLERKNLLMLMEKHPKATAMCAAGFFLVLELWHSSAWRPWLGKLLGIPIP